MVSDLVAGCLFVVGALLGIMATCTWIRWEIKK
jgi:hypothetical protein